MSGYGTAIMRRNFDTGTVTVEHADPVIGLSQELLDAADQWVFPDGDQETIQLDTAGEYLYRRRGHSTDPHMVIYDRIEP